MLVSEPRIGIDDSSFDLKYRLVRYLMPMNDMKHLEPFVANVTNSIQFGIYLIFFIRLDSRRSVIEDTISFALTDIESFSISGVNKAINVVTNLFTDLVSKAHHRGIMLHD